jgi:diacylglycerol kinase family enzyme
LSHFGIIEYAGHARDYVKTIELADWSGIVLASGDGLIYEVNTFIFYIQFLK